MMYQSNCTSSLAVIIVLLIFSSCALGPSEAELQAIAKEQRKNELKAMLFFDPILSGAKDVDCASCHHPVNGFAEFRDVSIGPNGQGFGSLPSLRVSHR